MRRFWPHAAVILAGAACLAAIWSLEPPIEVAPRARGPKMTPTPGHLFVRVITEQDVRAAKLTLRVAWDAARLDAPRVYRAQQTWGAASANTFGPNEITIEFNAREAGEDDHTPIRPIRGPGRLARLAFPCKRSCVEAGLDAVRLVAATAVAVDGRETALTDVKLAVFEPKGDLDEAVQPLIAPLPAGPSAAPSPPLPPPADD